MKNLLSLHDSFFINKILSCDHELTWSEPYIKRGQKMVKSILRKRESILRNAMTGKLRVKTAYTFCVVCNDFMITANAMAEVVFQERLCNSKNDSIALFIYTYRFRFYLTLYLSFLRDFVHFVDEIINHKHDQIIIDRVAYEVIAQYNVMEEVLV